MSASRFVDPLPAAIERKVRSLAPPDESVHIQVATDLADDLNFGERWLVVTDQRALVVSPDGDNGATSLPLREITATRLETYVGGGCLALERANCATTFVFFSSSLVPKFSRVADGIRQLCIGEPPLLPREIERIRCLQCGRLLHERNATCPKCVRKWNTLLRIAGYLRPYRGRAALLVPVMVAAALAELAPAVLIQHIIDDVLTPTLRLGLLIWLVLGLVGVRMIACVCDVGQRSLSTWLGSRVIADLRGQYYRHLQHLSLRFYNKHQLGTLMARAVHDAGRLEEFLVQSAPSVITYGLLVSGILGLLFSKSWVLALYALAPIPLVMLCTLSIWGRLMHDWDRLSAKWSRLFGHLSESISGIKVVKAFAQELRERLRFNRLNHELLEATVARERRWFTFFIAAQFLMSAALLCIWYVGGKKVLGAELTLGVLVAFITYLGMLYWPLQSFCTLHNSMAQAIAGGGRIFEVLDTAPEPYNDPRATPLRQSEGRVSFRGVSFGYDRTKPVLRGIDLDVASGEMIGLVGRSGAGKTTAMNLLCRFYDVDEGHIAIDGLDIRTIALEDLRRQIGIVLQDPYLLRGTIAENIAYGKPGAHLAEIIHAAKAANAHNFLVAKPDGYDTEVGEGGNRLSGGERQRIAIARAILRNPKILILDEATSSLDAESERSIQQAIGRLAKNRTIFVIAHRLSTLRSADRLAVLDKGRLVEVGSHEELMARQGVFYNLVMTQQGLVSAMNSHDGDSAFAANDDHDVRSSVVDNGATAEKSRRPEAVDPREIGLAREPAGTLRLRLENKSYDNIQLARVAPLSDPEHYVSFLNDRGEEICMIRDPADLDETSRQILREELARRYMTASVERIYSVHSELSISYFDVQTNRGRREFVVQNIHESTRWLGEGRLLLIDVDGNRFEIPMLDALDKRSARLITRLL